MATLETPQETAIGGDRSVEVPTPRVAVAAATCGAIGVVLSPWFVGVMFSVVALVLAYKVRDDIRAADGALAGRLLATWGTRLGWTGIALALVTLVVLIVGVHPLYS